MARGADSFILALSPFLLNKQPQVPGSPLAASSRTDSFHGRVMTLRECFPQGFVEQLLSESFS